MTDGTGGPPGDFSQMLGDFSAQADQMLTAAKEGQFAVSPEMGEAYKTALRDYLDSWMGTKTRFDHLAQSPKLGKSPYSQQVGDHAVRVADGDDLSAKTQLDALQDVANRAREAIEIAITKYKQRDSDGADQLKQFDRD
ncbi:hypothetical protein CFP71_27485 [Amycolatopsis thailandensis]|uniref:PE domain-containing protein n=1 Tax=Amycolatopsis thailandensis TaxID=589330 RepID=A0A229RV40_9PSEU|nr:hypothetical protein [Amycolatopsis thailandensis]OXM50532.1 hypothetical protein CFP71_27485 [Amycolatopsis thailandensis]